MAHCLMKSSSAQYLKSQSNLIAHRQMDSTQYVQKPSGESKLVLRSCKGNGKSTAKKREREDTDSKDAGLVRGNGEGSQKQYFQENFRLKAQINSLMSEVSTLKQQLMKAKVDQLLCKNDNRPIKALWEALNDKATPDIELPMAIVMDPRCGIERRSLRDDNLVDSEGFKLDDSTPLMMAVHAHRNDVVEALLVARADHSARDVCFGTAYLVAATKGHVTAMDLLVRYGADPFAVNDSGHSALNLAAFQGRAHVLQWLVQLGANTEAGVGIRNTPLLSRAYRDAPSIVALLDNGANLDAVDGNGMTPLHRASACGRIGAIETLVWEGASITTKDKRGRIPLEIIKVIFFRFTDAQQARVKALLTPTLLH